MFQSTNVMTNHPVEDITSIENNNDSENAVKMNEQNNDPTDNDELPIVCCLDSDRVMFRVVRATGKAMSSGGFGMSISDYDNNDRRNSDVKGEDNDIDEDETPKEVSYLEPNYKSSSSTTNEKDDNNANDEEKEKEPLNKSTGTTKSVFIKATEYLFIEEVVVLHERGLLRATMTQQQQHKHEQEMTLDSSQLYQLLPSMGMSLAMYLVYSHLRSQDFRVLRHDPKRLSILRQQRELQLQHQQQPQKAEGQQQRQKEEGRGLPPHKKGMLKLRRQVRQSIQDAPPPSIPLGEDAIQICWDAYLPNSNFGKTHPGLPDFYVAVTYYNVPLVRFSHIQQLVNGPCQGIPLKIATVSDSGT
jgi:hypothetical protein